MSCPSRRYVTGAAKPQFRPACGCPAGNAGFTVVELSLVIVIVAILGVMAGPRFFDNASFDERAYYDEVIASLRYAQKVAVATGCRVRVEITATNYSLAQQAPLSGHCDPADVGFPGPVLLASGEPVNGAAPNGITAAPAITFVYEPLGSTTLAADQVMAIGSRTFTVQANSGLIVAP